MTSLLDSWTRPMGDTGIGGHMSANYGDTRYTSPAQLDADIALMKSMHMTRVKFLVQGLAQVNAVRAFREAGFTVGIRRYTKLLNDDGSINDGALPEEELLAYAKVGAIFCEGSINEYDNETGKPPSWENIKRVAEYWRGHANTCAHVGMIPVSPAFEGDRLERWVLPVIQYMLDHGWGDQVNGSVIGGHFRTGRYYGPDRDNRIPEGVTFPPESDPVEPGDMTGFVWRSHEQWAKKLKRLLGYIPRMQSTEMGIEPHECREDLNLFADVNRRIAQSIPAYMDCGYFWLMIPGGMGDTSAWIANTRYANPLPIIKVFQDMPAPRPGVPELSDADLWTLMRSEKGDISINPDAALHKASVAAQLGLPEKGEWRRDGYLMYRCQHGGTAITEEDAKHGRWDKIKVVRW